MTNEHGWNGDIYCDEKTLDKPLHWRKPRRIFVNSMSDTFHEKVPFEFQAKIFDIIGKCHQHTFQILTKRVDNMCAFLNRYYDDPAYDNAPKNYKHCWLGVTCENQKTADERIPILLQIPAAVRFVSIEPMLGPIELRCIIGDPRRRCVYDCLRGTVAVQNNVVKDPVCGSIDWVIVGGESGPNARPMHPDWVRGIRDQCIAVKVPFFFKQWGKWEIANKENAARNGYVVTESRQGFLPPYNHKKFISINTDGSFYQDNPQPNSVSMARVGKKKAGCILDGQEWKQYPKGE